MEPAASATSLVSCRDVPASNSSWVASDPQGSWSPLIGTIEPTRFTPANSGVRVESIPIARNGSCGRASRYRPIQPLEISSTGDALCQMAIDEKCERLGFG